MVVAPVAVPRVEVAAVVVTPVEVAAVVVTPVEAVAAAMIETPMTTMDANLVRALVMKVKTPVHAMPDSQDVAVLCARRLLGAEHGTHQQ